MLKGVNQQPEEETAGWAHESGSVRRADSASGWPWQLRIVRDAECESVSHAGLYPAGEGAGYAGGIVSAAVDGARCAAAVLRRLAAA